MFEAEQEVYVLEHNLYLTEIPGNIQSLQKADGR